MPRRARYQPPYQATARMLQQVSDVSLALGRWQATCAGEPLSPRLRRDHRIRKIQATLASEANTLSVEQVTALLGGKRVLAPPHDLQEMAAPRASYADFNDSSSDCSAKSSLIDHTNSGCGITRQRNFT